MDRGALFSALAVNFRTDAHSQGCRAFLCEPQNGTEGRLVIPNAPSNGQRVHEFRVALGE